jgi:hypothetical protein
VIEGGGIRPMTAGEVLAYQAAQPPVTNAAPLVVVGRITAAGADIETTDADHGFILLDLATTNKYLVSVLDGEVVGTQISASPEVDMPTRRARLAALRADMRANPENYKPKLLREELKTLLDKRLDNINTNNCITGSNGRFTVYSTTVNAIKGVSVTQRNAARIWLTDIVRTPTNEVTVQVWSSTTAKAGVTTNDWTVTVYR